MRIVVDLDGVICTVKRPDESYGDVTPIAGAADALRALRAQGHQIIIQTARHMATCDGNVGKLMKKVGKVTLDWLELHGIEYDEIYFGKPNGHVYIDDRALRFERWSDITETTLAEQSRDR